MKTILKYQQGGDVPSFVDFIPFQGIGSSADLSGSAVTSDSSKKADNEKAGLDVMTKLADKLTGLPSDIRKITNSINTLYDEANLFGNGEINTSDLITTYLSAMQQIKVADFNQQQYKTASEEVIKNGGLHEAAIDEYGYVMVQDTKGAISKMSVSDYFKNADKVVPLTNSNLLNYRANNDALSFDNRFLDIVSNGVGEESVTKMIQGVLSGIGTTSITKEGYTEKQANNIQAGIELLTEARDSGAFDNVNDLMPIASLYKLGYTSKDQQSQITAALNYILKAMPSNAKAWLELKSGNADNPKEGAIDMIANLMFAHNSVTRDFSISPAKDPNVKEKDSTASSDKINPYISMQKQEGGTYGTFQLNAGTNNALMVDGTIYGNIQDSDWKPVGNTSMTEFMNGGLSGIVQNMHGISFGDRVIAPEDLNDIMYDNGGGIMVNLPCKVVNGAKVVDLSVLDRYNEAYQEFKSTPKTAENADEVFGKILYEYGLDELLDSQGLPNKNRFNQFLVVTGYAVDKQNKFYKNTDGDINNYIEDVDTHDEALMNVIKQSLSTDSKKSNYTIDTESWFESSSPDSSWFKYDHVYKGSLYIPISNNEAQGHNAGKQELPYNVMHQREYEYQLEQKRRTAQSASADILNIGV